MNPDARYFIYVNEQVVRTVNRGTWIAWIHASGLMPCVLKSAELRGIKVLTFFNGIVDYPGPARPFLTCVYGGFLHGTRNRYETREQALAGHDEIVARILARITGGDVADSK